MQKVLYYLASIAFLLFMAIDANVQAQPIPDKKDYAEEERGDTLLIAQLLSIREKMNKAAKPLFFLHIDVVQATMTVYHLIEEDTGNYFLEEVSTHLVGTPKFKRYPKGFGIITSTERSPFWAPTPGTVMEFKKRGINLEKFRNEQGKIIIPPGHALNYMGPVKMRIRFLEKQAFPKLNRDVYRIHGTLKKDEAKLGTRCSGGCIRTQNEELLRLDELMKGGFIITKYI